MDLKKTFFFLLVFFLLSFSQVWATDYYVGKTNCSDSGSGSQSRPWCTIQKAADQVGPGETVYIREGVYRETIYFSSSGTINNWIVFKNYPGEVPVVENPGGEDRGFDGQGISFVEISGFWLQGFGFSGIHCGWTQGCSDIKINYNVSDDNGESGIGIFNSNNILVENNIVSRNGWGPGWASGIDFWRLTGKNNTARGNVSFHNIDESDNHTDGNGFILDVSYGIGGAVFENNLSFENGGAGIAVTNSWNSTLLGNTLYHNWQDDRISELGEITFDGDSYNNVVVRNNTATAENGKPTFRVWEPFSNSQINHNNWYPDQSGQNPKFIDPDNVDFKLQLDSPLINTGSSNGVFDRDIGFDPQCLKKETHSTIWYARFAPDLNYIKSIGGIKNCFNPVSRPQPPGGAYDIGAYEYGGSSVCRTNLDTGSNIINLADMVALLSHWGETNFNYDLDNSGSVGLSDITFVLQYWGQSCQ